ncbi:DUF3267 domain-containing protein [Sporosarcina sp. G11-34]|uniref:DUF3267 domain-containing protein n=1 Tax=Sporosarcina sp. G11-34 TaxID=2849605 RepID=UPI0022A9F06E|nr:DUF3267 domain-containing protein [Sporosarcina sp. G11-34]MCZ2259046.1 DUF3267 domain-containing protein [Sporosarcina sp. G11-34]
MNELPEPDKVIDIDLPVVAKKGLYITGLALIILLVIHFVLEKGMYIRLSFISILLFIVGYVLLIVLHELFHLLGFRLFAGVPWRKMVVGVNLKLGIAYATTDELMSNKEIRKALLLPFWMTGILPALIGLYIGSGVVIVLSALLIGGAVGDFVMYKELKKLPDNWFIKDDPELPRLYVFSPKKTA